VGLAGKTLVTKETAGRWFVPPFEQDEEAGFDASARILADITHRNSEWASHVS